MDPGGLEATIGYKPVRDTGTFSYATHAALVAVDPEIGDVEILDYVIVEDGGKLVNPMIADGQIYGGFAQGVGTALYEEMPFDALGQPLASTFSDYLLPGPTEVPAPALDHMETLAPYTEFGVKGIGEGGAIAPPAAIANAINDALRPLGTELTCRRSRRAAFSRRWRSGAPRETRPLRLRMSGDIAAALALAERSNGIAKFIAGGQSLGPMLNLRLAQPELLVDLTRMGELKQVEETAETVSIGACVTHADIEDGRVPDVEGGVLGAVARGIAYRAVRNRGTIGGSLAHADPAADWISCLAALGASVVVRGRAARRSLRSRISCSACSRPRLRRAS